MRDSGSAEDAMMAWPKPQKFDAVEFFATMGFDMTASWRCRTYGIRNAGVLARGWCHKMEFLLRHYIEKGVRGSTVSVDQLLTDEYEEPVEFHNLWHTGSDTVKDAILTIRRILNPGWTEPEPLDAD
jgi:hypothetical protein